MAENVFPQLKHFLHQLFLEGKIYTQPEIPYRVCSQVPKLNEQQAVDRLEEEPCNAYQRYVVKGQGSKVIESDWNNDEIDYVGN